METSENDPTLPCCCGVTDRIIKEGGRLCTNCDIWFFTFLIDLRRPVKPIFSHSVKKRLSQEMETDKNEDDEKKKKKRKAFL